MMTEERFKETNNKMSYEEYKNAIAVNVIRKIVFIETHIEDYQKLMVVLVCVLI